MNIKKGLISLGIWVSVGAVAGVVIGEVSYHYSQPHKVMVFQKAIMDEIINPKSDDVTVNAAEDLFKHAKDAKLCGKTIMNEYDDLIGAAESEENSCKSASYTTTGTSSTKTTADVVVSYTDVLLEACK